jgi:hypothetical protein
MLSPKKIIESGDIGYDIYATDRGYSESNEDLYAWPFSVTNPKDTSLNDSYLDCYRVTLRNYMYSRNWNEIPKVICSDVQSSEIKAGGGHIQDCYCVTIRNGSYSHHIYDANGNSSKTNLFLHHVYFAEL